MASASVATPDSLVTLKVMLDGSNRRFKLPLRDLGAATLEDKLRSFLGLSKFEECIIERYSDSAASYVVLDAANISVYKQLYRAAKAKQKLKLRITTRNNLLFGNNVYRPSNRPAAVQDDKKPFKPATVEAEPEADKHAEGDASTDQSTETAPIIATEESNAPTASPQAPKTVASGPPPVPARMPIRLAPVAGNARNVGFIKGEQRAIESKLSALEDYVEAYERFRRNQAKGSLGNAGAASSTPSPDESPAPAAAKSAAPPPPHFSVCCNSCDHQNLGPHYHCSTCDDGDFDLCLDCVDRGITCHGADHWLIKRFFKDGVIIASTTERLPPKAKATKPAETKPAEAMSVEVKPFSALSSLARLPAAAPIHDILQDVHDVLSGDLRTCNNCVRELLASEFVHCTTCDDFDLCKGCFARDNHGHHPKHVFKPAVDGAHMEFSITSRLGAGRGQFHNAICDGCDRNITGVRHKCIDCPDWDYCNDCVDSADFVHPGHRFIPLYETLEPTKDIVSRFETRPVHFGICCDGPLCNTVLRQSSYIVGVRYKCAVCHDTDFCASCEASPANTHNKTHPLIKFRSPVRHVSVTTTGEHENGRPMPAMGDRALRKQTCTRSRSTETTAINAATTNFQTVVDVQPSVPSSPAPVIKEETKEEDVSAVLEAAPAVPSAEQFVGVYVRDTVADGTTMPPSRVFEQTWTLRNDGEVAWPAGCSVRFVGGDYMGHVDPAHPAGISELVSASESTKCYTPVGPGQEFNFTVLLRTPTREGKVISYWRLTTPDGEKFGHRLWCDVSVKATQPKVEEPEEKVAEPPVEPQIAESVPQLVTKSEEVVSEQISESQMIFPKLEKESPVSSIHQEQQPSVASSLPAEDDEFEDCGEDVEWAEDESDDGFMTDEEYDILDASDEEYLGEQQKMLRK